MSKLTWLHHRPSKTPIVMCRCSIVSLHFCAATHEISLKIRFKMHLQDPIPSSQIGVISGMNLLEGKENRGSRFRPLMTIIICLKGELKKNL